MVPEFLTVLNKSPCIFIFHLYPNAGQQFPELWQLALKYVDTHVSVKHGVPSRKNLRSHCLSSLLRCQVGKLRPTAAKPLVPALTNRADPRAPPPCLPTRREGSRHTLAFSSLCVIDQPMQSPSLVCLHIFPRLFFLTKRQTNYY